MGYPQFRNIVEGAFLVMVQVSWSVSKFWCMQWLVICNFTQLFVPFIPELVWWEQIHWDLWSDWLGPISVTETGWGYDGPAIFVPPFNNGSLKTCHPYLRGQLSTSMIPHTKSSTSIVWSCYDMCRQFQSGVRWLHDLQRFQALYLFSLCHTF